MLASISVFWGDSGMNSAGNFNVYLMFMESFSFKNCWGTSLSTSLSASLVLLFNLILVNVFLLLCSMAF